MVNILPKTPLNPFQTPQRAALARQLEKSTSLRGPGLKFQTAASFAVSQSSAATAISPVNSIPQSAAKGPAGM